jgi:mono/diheme cytochrome c family protein/HEAT repeat protein
MGRRLGMFAGIAVVALVAPLVVLGQTGALKLSTALNKPWPAAVVAEDEDKPAPVLSAADSMKTMTMAPGYKLDLVANEPLTKDPILAEFDGDGRLWVVEMHGFAINEKLENSLEPVGEVAILEDTNNDGVFDKRTVFLDKLVLPRAMKVLDKNCALVGAPPELVKACDTNGDLKADTRDLVDGNFGVKGNVEHTANGLYWGMDNTLVVSEYTYNLEFKDGKFSTFPVLNRGQWGVTQDNGGRIFRNVNTDPLFVDYVAPKYYSRNPNLVRTNGLYENLVKQEDTNIWPIHPTRGVNRGYRADIFREDGSSTYYGGVSSPLIYRGDRLPKDIQNQPFVVDGPTNIVHTLNLKNTNGDYAASDFYKKGEFLASTDIRFRPVQIIGGPDGAMYIVDMYRGVSQDGPIQTDYLRDYTAKRELWKGINYGRIYRVNHEGATLDTTKPQMSKETPAQLVAHLSHPNGWWRDTAQQLLVQRGDKSVGPALKKLATSAPQAYTRLQALWTLNGLGLMDQATATKGLTDASRDVRAASVRVSEPFLANAPVLAAVVKLGDDQDAVVRRQVAASLGELPKEQRLAPIVALMKKHADDPILIDIAVSGLSGQEGQALNQVVGQPNAADAALVLAGATAKGRDPAAVQTLMTMSTDASKPEPIRVALLKGLALGLTGGTRQQQQVVAGGRAGSAAPGVGPRRTAAAGYELAAEPTGVTAAAAGKGDVADAAKAVVALVTWPGKPALAAAAARNADEEKLFVAGKQLFADNCAGCHGADGAGIERVGAKLAGSQYGSRADDSIVRILINGKEGSIGVMPPLGAAMSDEDTAAVLTFIRGSWGNTGTPVVPAAVKETRQAYSHRTTPWTDEELAPRRR